jgi:CDP-4-dehydro-6-deoxyglucose reductase, E1
MKQNKLNWLLMKDTISFMDKFEMIKFILTTKKFTNGEKVKEFENKWNQWLGSSYSLFVSSGSTANLLLLDAVKEKYNLKDGDKVLVPACTWVTNISPVIQLGFTPVFCDINFNDFSFDISKLEKIKQEHPDIKIIFATHLLGLRSDLESLQSIFPNALILEDICESHGVESSPGTRQGSNSLGATFSFYFGHHMTTIEGGMISTHDRELYELMRLKRSHGMAREGSAEYFEKYKLENPHLLPSFLFITQGYNFRNHELPAVLGISQLSRLDKFVSIRRKNYSRYHQILQQHQDKFYIPKKDFTNSSFCFPFICKDKKYYDKLIEEFKRYNIEFRPVVGGNLLKHPFLKEYEISTAKPHNVDILQDRGLYIGNNHFVSEKELSALEKILNELN